MSLCVSLRLHFISDATYFFIVPITRHGKNFLSTFASSPRCLVSLIHAYATCYSARTIGATVSSYSPPLSSPLPPPFPFPAHLSQSFFELCSLPYVLKLLETAISNDIGPLVLRSSWDPLMVRSGLTPPHIMSTDWRFQRILQKLSKDICLHHQQRLRSVRVKWLIVILPQTNLSSLDNP